VPGHLRQTFAALSVRPFRILWIGTIFAFVAFFMSMVTQSVVAFDLTGQNRAVGFVVFSQGIMMFTLAPLGGALADRWPKRRVIAVCQLLTMSVFFWIAWGIASERIQIGWLMMGSAVMGTSFAFMGPARQSLAVELVGKARRGNAVALTQVANSGCRVLGPAVAGAFLAWSTDGVWAAYIVMGVLYLISALSLGLLPRSVVSSDASRARLLDDILAGLRYVRDHPQLRPLMLLFTLVIMLGFPYITLLPGFVQNQLGLPTESSSVQFGVTAFGALTASVVVARYADSPRSPALFSLMALGFALSLLAVAAAPSFFGLTVIVFVAGVFSGGFQTLAGAVIIRSTEPRYVGRVMSLTMLSFAGFGLMGLPIGYLADALGERTALAVMGLAVGSVVLWLRRSSSFKRHSS